MSKVYWSRAVWRMAVCAAVGGVNVVKSNADVVISTGTTSNMTCADNICTAVSKDAVLNVDDLTGMLTNGDVTVATGSLANDIDVAATLEWTSESRLTLDAARSVRLKKSVTVDSRGALTITTNDGGHDGALIITPDKASVQFSDIESSLVINGTNYTLASDLATLASKIADAPRGNYALANSYDASADGVYVQPPIQGIFQGVFEGLGNRITKMSIASDAPGATLGLFAAIGRSGLIQNLGITDANLIAETANSIGILTSENLGALTGCFATGFISSPSVRNEGGLVGGNSGSISGSYANVRISSSQFAAYAGGLVGYNDNRGRIINSFSLGSIALRNSSTAYAGGLVGENQGLVENTFSRSHLAIGKNEAASTFGGLVGKLEGKARIKSSYAAGLITNKGLENTIGGLVGEDETTPGSISDAYWDLEMGIQNPHDGAGNRTDDAGITGLTTAQFQDALPPGFQSNQWRLSVKINGGFPYLNGLKVK